LSRLTEYAEGIFKLMSGLKKSLLKGNNFLRLA
jgi:hypothetical protein